MRLSLILSQISGIFRQSENDVSVTSENVNPKVVTFEDCVRINNARFKNEKIPQINSRNQYFAAITANILALSVGISIGWTSPTIQILQSTRSPLNYSITLQQASWIGSFLPLGALFGVLLFGWLSNVIGRFWALWIASFPQIFSWLCIINASTVEFLYIGRFTAGICTGAVFTLVPLYVSEISDNSARGFLGSIFLLTVNFGTLLMFIFGSYFSYSFTSKFMLSFPIVYAAIFMFFPETPYFLLQHGKTKKAENSLKFLNGCRKAVDTPDAIKIRLLVIAKKVEDQARSRTKSSFNEELKQKSPRKALIIGIVLVMVNQLCGCFAFINYTADIFEASGSSLSPNQSAIIIAAIMVFGSGVSIWVIKRMTRKFLYSLSCAGTMIGLLLFGVYGTMRSYYDLANFNWVSIVCMSFVIFIASAGLIPLTFIMLSEILPPRIRSSGTTLCTALLWFIAFLLLRFFPLAVNVLQLHVCMYFFCSITLLGMIFVIFFVPETKNRSTEAIEKMLMN
ncbi:hypothetical protein PVAND_013799 [Polypedilum vanderplanki]|uniref:Major facilitator superfamily (MFS) profile domain-containing protein n=1 Tax=Polypedilum vanderplanki TaxID=319348 RepID=A0A9J6CSE4_POLVA|nr:hypothetical protein PVAND_013799 [Polypedilum vanderplanki]